MYERVRVLRAITQSTREALVRLCLELRVKEGRGALISELEAEMARSLGIGASERARRVQLALGVLHRGAEGAEKRGVVLREAA